MLAEKMENPLENDTKIRSAELIALYRSVSDIRDPVLFEKFLPIGYRLTTLDTVDSQSKERIVYAKLHVGMLITLYDDLADNRVHRNPRLLGELYQLNLGRDRSSAARLSVAEREILDLAKFLFANLQRVLAEFPNHASLLPALRFDFQQFYLANQYSELCTDLPNLRNLPELAGHGPFNMGIVIAGMIDLAALGSLDAAEIGACREIFLSAQRMGRISNMRFTLAREQAEQDRTNEIEFRMRRGHTLLEVEMELQAEFHGLSQSISAQRLGSFSTQRYAEGFQALHVLHRSLLGRI